MQLFDVRLLSTVGYKKGHAMGAVNVAGCAFLRSLQLEQKVYFNIELIRDE